MPSDQDDSTVEYAVSIASADSDVEEESALEIYIIENEHEDRRADLLEWVHSALASDLDNLPILKSLLDENKGSMAVLASSIANGWGEPRFFHSIIAKGKDTDDFKVGCLTYTATRNTKGSRRLEYYITSVHSADARLNYAQRQVIINALVGTAKAYVQEPESQGYSTVYYAIPEGSEPPPWLAANGFRRIDVVSDPGGSRPEAGTKVRLETFVFIGIIPKIDETQTQTVG